MNAYDYLIVGGGMTADAAVKGIRELDPEGTIAILSAESDPPYSRPPLSKTLWSGKKSVEEIDCGTGAHNVDLILNCTVSAINRTDHCVIDGEGKAYGYHKLLLATGGSPRRLPIDDEPVMYYRSLADYRRLLDGIKDAHRYAVVGGGFIGSEMAAALTGKSKLVTMVYPEEALGAGVFPAELAGRLSGYYREKGVTLLEGCKLSNLKRQGARISLGLDNGNELDVDGVVAGIGIVPNTELAESAGLHVDNGIVVDDRLRTRDEAIYAAGDVANFHNPALDCRMRVEHEDNALTMGRMAGRNMAGAKESYDHLPFFYSDLFDVGYEAVGLLAESAETVGVWSGLQDPGIWAYLSDGRVCGVLLWNLFGQVDAGRALIESDEQVDPPQLEKQLRVILEKADDG